MADATRVIIRGVWSVDDRIQIDCSGPAGQARFACPDCGCEVILDVSGTITCVCRSVFVVERRSWVIGRAYDAVRRAGASWARSVSASQLEVHDPLRALGGALQALVRRP